MDDTAVPQTRGYDEQDELEEDENMVADVEEVQYEVRTTISQIYLSFNSSHSVHKSGPGINQPTLEVVVWD